VSLERSEPFRVAIVAGVTPDKWVRRWRERFPERPIDVLVVEDADQTAVLHDGRARMGFVRLPVERDGLHLIPLWSEVPVVVLARDHPLAEFDELQREDLADELVLERLTPRIAVETVAAGTGVVLLPMSVARAHQRKDVRAVPVTDLPETQVGLAWRVDDEDPRVEEFIGIVRGRTERSSRGAPAPPAQPRKQQQGKKKPAAPRSTSKRRR
jgi:DNA-binding transcriptional LysR family regulator